jgi:hypothetical protein
MKPGGFSEKHLEYLQGVPHMMKRTLPFTLLCLLMLPLELLAAGDTCVRKNIVGVAGTPLAEVEMAEATHRPVHVAFSSGLAVGDQVMFEAHIDGLRHFSEEVEIVVGEVSNEKLDLAATPVVELLAANPARLGMLYRLATSRQVEIAIFHNGTLINTVPFLTLVSETEGLNDVWTQALRSTVSTKQDTVPLRRNSCWEFCDDQQYDCYLNRCGQFGSESCYDACDLDWDDCIEDCGICTPSSTTSTTLTTVQLTPQNVIECRRTVPFGKGFYSYQRKKIKKTVTTTTMNSDCTTTVTTQVTYHFEFCWKLEQLIGCGSAPLTYNFC